MQYNCLCYEYARVAELVDALVSGTSEATRGGSSPLSRTKIKTTDESLWFYFGLLRKHGLHRQETSRA